MKPEVEEHVKLLRVQMDLWMRLSYCFESLAKAADEIAKYYQYASDLEEKCDKILLWALT